MFPSKATQQDRVPITPSATRMPNFRMSMRLYLPKPEVFSGEWTPPAVTPQP